MCFYSCCADNKPQENQNKAQCMHANKGTKQGTSPYLRHGCCKAVKRLVPLDRHVEKVPAGSTALTNLVHDCSASRLGQEVPLPLQLPGPDSERFGPWLGGLATNIIRLQVGYLYCCGRSLWQLVERPATASTSINTAAQHGTACVSRPEAATGIAPKTNSSHQAGLSVCRPNSVGLAGCSQTSWLQSINPQPSTLKP